MIIVQFCISSSKVTKKMKYMVCIQTTVDLAICTGKGFVRIICYLITVSFTCKRKKYLGKGQLIFKIYLQNIREYL